MRARFLIAALVIVACLPARAEPPNAPATADTRRANGERQPSATSTIASTILGPRVQGTVADREDDEEVWSENPDAPDEEDLAPPCKLCPQAPPARLVRPPLRTAPRN
jgi:hypothetical protein